MLLLLKEFSQVHRAALKATEAHSAQHPSLFRQHAKLAPFWLCTSVLQCQAGVVLVVYCVPQVCLGQS